MATEDLCRFCGKEAVSGDDWCLECIEAEKGTREFEREFQEGS